MRITKKDVGRKVVDGRGKVETIIAFRESLDYPVLTHDNNGYLSLYTEDGVFSLDRPESGDNLVRFLDEEEELAALMFADLMTLVGE